MGSVRVEILNENILKPICDQEGFFHKLEIGNFIFSVNITTKPGTGIFFSFISDICHLMYKL